MEKERIKLWVFDGLRTMRVIMTRDQFFKNSEFMFDALQSGAVVCKNHRFHPEDWVLGRKSPIANDEHIYFVPQDDYQHGFFMDDDAITIIDNITQHLN